MDIYTYTFIIDWANKYVHIIGSMHTAHIGQHSAFTAIGHDSWPKSRFIFI